MVWNPGLGGLGLALCLAVVSASTDVESHRIFGRVLQDAMEGSLCGALCQGCAAADVAGGCCGQPDGRVGIADVLGFLGAYGVFPVEEKFDIAGGPGVGVDDILAVLGTYGTLVQVMSKRGERPKVKVAKGGRDTRVDLNIKSRLYSLACGAFVIASRTLRTLRNCAADILDGVMCTNNCATSTTCNFIFLHKCIHTCMCRSKLVTIHDQAFP